MSVSAVVLPTPRIGPKRGPDRESIPPCPEAPLARRTAFRATGVVFPEFIVLKQNDGIMLQIKS